MSRGVFLQSEDEGLEVIFRELRQEADYQSLNFGDEEEGYEQLANNAEYAEYAEQRRIARENTHKDDGADEPAEVESAGNTEEDSIEPSRESVEEDADTDSSNASDVDVVEDFRNNEEAVSAVENYHTDETAVDGLNEPAWDEPVTVEDDVDETVDADAAAEPDVFEAVTSEDESLNKAPLADYELPVEPYDESNVPNDVTEVDDTAGTISSTEDGFDDDAFALDTTSSNKDQN